MRILLFSILILTSALTWATELGAPYQLAFSLRDPNNSCERLSRTENGRFFLRYQINWAGCGSEHEFRFSVYARDKKGWAKTDYQMNVDPLITDSQGWKVFRALISEDGRTLLMMADKHASSASWLASGPIEVGMKTPFTLLDSTRVNYRKIVDWGSDFSTVLTEKTCNWGDSNCPEDSFELYSFKEHKTLASRSVSIKDGSIKTSSLNKNYFMVNDEIFDVSGKSRFKIPAGINWRDHLFVSLDGHLSYLPDNQPDLTVANLRTGKVATRKLTSAGDGKSLWFDSHGNLLRGIGTKGWTFEEICVLDPIKDEVKKCMKMLYSCGMGGASFLDLAPSFLFGVKEVCTTDLMQGPGLDQEVDGFEKGADPNYFSFEVEGRGAGHAHFINDFEDLLWGTKAGEKVTPGIYVRSESLVFR